MPEEHFTADEARKLAVLIARVWADPQLANEYQRAPEAVLSGAGIHLAGRAVPNIPEKPAELAAQRLVGVGVYSSASSASTVSCPCSACTASCAGLHEFSTELINSVMKLAESPEGRQQARKMAAAWNINLKLQP
jgi:hypothetical protein